MAKRPGFGEMVSTATSPLSGGSGGDQNWRKLEERYGGRKKQSTRDAEAAQREAIQAQYDKSQGVYGDMAKADEALYGNMNAASGVYKGELAKLRDQADRQSGDAQQFYSGTIQPKMQDMMDRATTESKSAMTLADAGDPNNAVNTGWRDLYNQQGNEVRQQGQQDYGVLAALGAQATGQSLGAGSPMTAGAMGQIQAANMGQAGEAYARAQQRMHALRERGIDVGRQESGLQYERGERAHDRESQSVANFQNANQMYQNQMAGYRGEHGGYAGGIYGQNAGLAQLQHGLSSAQGGRQLQSINDLYGGQAAQAQGQANQGYAESAAGQQQLGALIGAAATVGGAYVGGPAMAAGGTAANINAGANAVNAGTNVYNASQPQQSAYAPGGAGAPPASTYGQNGVTYQMSPGAQPNYYNYGQPGQNQYGAPYRPYG